MKKTILVIFAATLLAISQLNAQKNVTPQIITAETLDLTKEISMAIWKQERFFSHMYSYSAFPVIGICFPYQKEAYLKDDSGEVYRIIVRKPKDNEVFLLMQDMCTGDITGISNDGIFKTGTGFIAEGTLEYMHIMYFLKNAKDIRE